MVSATSIGHRYFVPSVTGISEEQEKVILEMIRIVEEAGTSMTTPVGVIRLDSQVRDGDTQADK